MSSQQLTLRLYPTSYPSSTVGGWLAQGGAGIGSYEFGYFRQNVIAVRLVLPGGEIRELTGDQISAQSIVAAMALPGDLPSEGAA